MEKKYALITGASSGIGAALAMEYAKNGHSILLVARNRERLENKKNEVESRYEVDADVHCCDISKTVEIDGLIEWLKKSRYCIDTLVNNAGIGYWGKFVDEDPSQIERMLSLNVVGLTYLTRRSIELMRGKGGTILNVASAAALIPPPPMVAAYAASKKYVRYFTEAIEYELRNEKIFVSLLYPPDVETGFQKEAGASESFKLGANEMTVDDIARIAYRQLAKGKKRITPRIFRDKILDRVCCVLPRNVYNRMITGMVSERIAK